MLWCGTCHNPHQTPAEPVAYYRERCLGCHSATLAKSRGAPGRDCVSCHMPRLPARDGGHTVFTDHRIGRRPDSTKDPVAGETLAAWREPETNLRRRNLALALVAAGLENESAQEVIRGYRLLNEVANEFSSDPAVLTSLGTVLLRGKQPAEAAQCFAKVLQLRPDYAPYKVNAASALLASGKTSDAAMQLQGALRLDSLLPQAVEMLSRIYREQGEAGKAAARIERYQHDMGFTPIRQDPKP